MVGEAPLGVTHRQGWGNRGHRHRATVSSCSALGRGVDGEGMVGPSGIAEITRNMASALGAMKGRVVHGLGRGPRRPAVP